MILQQTFRYCSNPTTISVEYPYPYNSITKSIASSVTTIYLLVSYIDERHFENYYAKKIHINIATQPVQNLVIFTSTCNSPARKSFRFTFKTDHEAVIGDFSLRHRPTDVVMSVRYKIHAYYSYNNYSKYQNLI